MWVTGSRATADAERGSHPVRGAAHGFTLVEILVVIVIVGVAVSLTSLSLGAGIRADAAAAQMLGDRVASARDLAESSGRPTALRFGTNPLGELSHRSADGDWQVVKADGNNPTGTAISRITQGGVATALDQPIVFSPEGVSHGVTITFFAAGVSRTLHMDSANRIVMTDRLEAAP